MNRFWGLFSQPLRPFSRIEGQEGLTSHRENVTQPSASTQRPIFVLTVLKDCTNSTLIHVKLAGSQ
jgi:hypothetical protein